MIQYREYIRKRIGPSLAVTLVLFSITGCGSDPYQAGPSEFGMEVTAHMVTPQNSGWMVYVAPGRVTTGRLWFIKQNPVVYTAVYYSGTAAIKDIVIKFGNKTVTSPEINTKGIGSAGVEFYVKSSRIPQVMDISWSENGRPHHLRIDANSMVELPWVDVPS